MNTKDLLNTIIDRQDLTSSEASFLLEEIIAGNLNNSQITAVLIGLRSKGETVDEIVGFIKTMRKHMVKLSLSSRVRNDRGDLPFGRLPRFARNDIIDIVGTGGDGAGTFNISTAASFVVAGAGVNVAKHGNRAASSKCGSADVLESLGVNIQLTPEQATGVLESVGMVFLFAPLYHPAMKNIGPIRKELGVRTIFNFLGPFLNPASTKRQLIGVPNVEIAKKLALVSLGLNYKHLIIVTSKDGMDEISTNAQTHVFEIKGKKITKKIINPNDYGRLPRRHNKRASRNDSLRGGDAKENADIIRAILSGQKGPKRDIVVLNSAYALYVSGKAKTVKEGIALAERSIDSGSAKKVLDRLIKETQKYAK